MVALRAVTLSVTDQKADADEAPEPRYKDDFEPTPMRPLWLRIIASAQFNPQGTKVCHILERERVCHILVLHNPI